MSSLVQSGLGANESQLVAPVSMGDVGLATFFQTYFNGRNSSAYNHGPGRFDRRDHFQLVDSDQVFEHAGEVIRTVSIDHLTWVNTGFMPTRETKKLEFEVTVIRFDQNVNVEQVPNEAVARYMDIQKEKINFRSKRYGLGMYFEVDRMMTDEGKADFALFTKKIALVFRQHAAFIALARFLQPDKSDAYWYSQYNAHPMNVTDAHIQREVTEFAAAHKSETGAMQLIWQYAKAFERHNNVKPAYVIFHPEKQAVFKFNNPIMNEYYRAGPDGPGRIMDYDEIGNIQGMSFRGFPSFSAQCYNAQDEAEMSMNSHDVEIGNFFVFRRSPFMNIDAFKSGVHNYIDIFSENRDGMYRIHERELLKNCGRWRADGSLHEDHRRLLQTYRPSRRGDDIDMFIFYDKVSGQYDVCRHIGDMESKHVDHVILNKMVQETLRTVPNLSAVRAALVAVNALAYDPNPVGTDADEENMTTLVEFASHVGRRLGGSKNPAFNGDRMAHLDGYNLSATDKNGLTFIDNCLLYQRVPSTATHRSAGDQTRSAEDTMIRLREIMAEIATRVSRGDYTEDQFQILVNFEQAFRTVAERSHGVNEIDGPIRDLCVKTASVVISPANGRLDAEKFEAIHLVTGILSDLDNRVGEITPNLYARLDALCNGWYNNMGAAFELQTRLNNGRRATAGLKLRAAFDKIVVGAGGNGMPLHFNGVGQADARVVSAGRQGHTALFGAFQDVNLYSFGGSTMQTNLQVVMEAFTDPLERAVALAILATPIHRDVWDTMLSFNIQIPCEYVILRPFQQYLMSDLILARGGREMGETLVGYGHTAVGWKVANKTGDLHTTQWMGAIMYNYSLRCIIRNVFHERAYGGAGHTFFSEREWDMHVQNDFYTRGYEKPSLLGVMIPIGSPVKEDYVTVQGRAANEPETARLHYATALYYTLHYSFNLIKNNSPSLIHDGTIPRTNVTCFQGTQRQCGNINGDPGEMVENKGHLGIERPGDRDVRMGGMKMKPSALKA